MVWGCQENRSICFASASQAVWIFTQSFLQLSKEQAGPILCTWPTGYVAILEPRLWVQGLFPHTCASPEDTACSRDYLCLPNPKTINPVQEWVYFKNKKGIARSQDFLYLSDYPPLWALELWSHSFYQVATIEHWDNHFSGILGWEKVKYIPYTNMDGSEFDGYSYWLQMTSTLEFIEYSTSLVLFFFTNPIKSNPISIYWIPTICQILGILL